MFSDFILYFSFFTTLAKNVPTDASSRSSSSTLLERNVSAESSLTVKLEKSKGSEHVLFRNIMEVNVHSWLTPTLIEELKWKRVVRKSRKQINTTTRKKSQYVKKTFIYRGSFLTFCITLIGSGLWIYLWILMLRIEIKNRSWSLSPAERITWLGKKNFQVENLDDELSYLLINKVCKEIERSVLS
uniref:Uncharacterized protein n=1 Tax=Wuchereria bancrofti TaxID=6293 RepID=A0AAF5Q7L7_WUCBA